MKTETKDTAEQKDTTPVRIFLFKKDKAEFKALCAKGETSMQAALEDYIRDCVAQGVLL